MIFSEYIEGTELWALCWSEAKGVSSSHEILERLAHSME
jgi:hypothetical protein